MRLCKNTNGYTLIEALIALSVLAVLISLFPLWLRVLDHPEDVKGIAPMEVELFFQQAGQEIREAVALDKGGRKLLLQKNNGDIISYGLVDGIIRRRVNGRGSVWMLQKVGDVRFKLLGPGVKITITGRKGEVYERIFIPFAQRAG